MNNLIAMRKVKTDRTEFSPNKDDFLLRQEDLCGAEVDRFENEFRRVRNVKQNAGVINNTHCIALCLSSITTNVTVSVNIR